MLNLVRDAEIGDPTAKEVLKIIADQANDAGTSVWSSIEYFKFCTERSRSTVKRALRFLQDEGFLKHVGWTRYGTHLWALDTWALGECVRVWVSPEEIDLEGVQTEPEGEVTVNQGEGQTEPVTPKEPKNTNSVSVEAEHITVFHAILEQWLIDFPNKTQPRATNTSLQGKTKARLKVPTFKTGLWAAMQKAKDSPSLMHDSWFQLEYLLRNDNNYEKVAAGEFNWKDEDAPKQVSRPKFVDARPKEDK
jgi:hypothetical protein